MQSNDSPKDPKTIDSIKEEISQLGETQTEVLHKATFLGMGKDEAKALEKGREKIADLSKKLRQLQEAEKPVAILDGRVQRVIPPVGPSEPEKVEIAVEQAEDLYKEIRIDNTFTNIKDGESVALKPGAHVEVVIQADPNDTEKLDTP